MTVWNRIFKQSRIFSRFVLLTWIGVVAVALAASSGSTASAAPQATMFRVRIENISGGSSLPTPLSPGVWTVHSSTGPLFTTGTADRGQGLVAIAEDGNPSALAAALAGQAGIASSGAFNTPIGASAPGPLLPGGAYEFTFSATPDAPRLSLATMFVHSNDIFIAPDEMGIDLFNPDGTPMAERDVTSELMLWDVGSEVNEAPGMGPNQAPRQAGPNTGAAEGIVARFTNTTRGLPIASGIARVSVTGSGGTFTITVENVSASSDSLTTPIAPVFWATHNNTWSLFTVGAPAGSSGLETLAEDGSPANLVTSHTGAPGTGSVGAQTTTVERPGDPPGPAMPGERFRFTVTPDTAHPRLSIAAMVVDTNDVFLAFGPEGVALLKDDGTPRSASDINADMQRMLAVWDAGTEANEVPGVGPNQAPRQAAGNTGPADPNTPVRRYADATNDLAGPGLGGFAEVTIEASADPLSFDVTVLNTSNETAYPGMLTPVVWATHNSSASLFDDGMPASTELERLAEDGNHTPLLDMLDAMAGVGVSGVAAMPDGGDPGPLPPGSEYTFTVTMDPEHPYLSIASMVVPSNDTFLAFDPAGLRLLTDAGEPRSDEDIAADVETQLVAWDAGTEQNQAGAAGPDQAPRQAGPNTGANEGHGLVRLLNDPVWRYPAVSDVVRVTITPLEVAETPAGDNTLTVRVFMDYRCDRIFQNGVDIPLRDVPVTLSFPNGARETRRTRPFGVALFNGFDASGGATVSVELPSALKGYSLVRCPHSAGDVDLSPGDFRFRHKQVQFGVTLAGEMAGP
jgi:hypothetical protein